MNYAVNRGRLGPFSWWVEEDCYTKTYNFYMIFFKKYFIWFNCGKEKPR